MEKENDDKMNDFMLSIAWNGIEGTQQSIQKIDDKANNTITFSGILMTIIGGILVSVIDEIHPLIVVFLIINLILLAFGMYHALKTLWLKNQEVLDILTTFKSLDLTNFSQAAIDFAVSVGAWQTRAKEIGDGKSIHLLKSMKFIIGSLILVIAVAFISAIWYLIPILYNFWQKLWFLYF
jgi:hypothetical protein